MFRIASRIQSTPPPVTFELSC